MSDARELVDLMHQDAKTLSALETLDGVFMDPKAIGERIREAAAFIEATLAPDREADGWICTPPTARIAEGHRVVHRSTDRTLSDAIVEMYRSDDYSIKPFFLHPDPTVKALREAARAEVERLREALENIGVYVARAALATGGQDG